MSQYDILMQALQEQQLLSQAQAGHEGVMSRFRPIEQKMQDVNTARFPRGLMGAGEAIFDAIRRPGAQKQYYAGLEEALSSARGVDEIKAQIEMMAQVRAAEEQRAYDEKQALAKFQRENDAKVSLEREKEQGRNDRAALNANKPNLTYNIPAGYMPVDQSNPMAGVTPIPGSEQDMERKAAEAADSAKAANATAKYSGILDEVNQAFSNVNNLTAGFIGPAAGKISGTQAYTLARQLDTIKGNLGFDRLQQMRDESKTGGALGQVSNIELGLLTSSLTALDAGLPPDQLRRNLSKVQTHYQNFLDALSGKMPQGYDQNGNPAQADDDPLGLFQ